MIVESLLLAPVLINTERLPQRTNIGEPEQGKIVTESDSSKGGDGLGSSVSEGAGVSAGA